MLQSALQDITDHLNASEPAWVLPIDNRTFAFLRALAKSHGGNFYNRIIHRNTLLYLQDKNPILPVASEVEFGRGLREIAELCSNRSVKTRLPLALFLNTSANAASTRQQATEILANQGNDLASEFIKGIQASHSCSDDNDFHRAIAATNEFIRQHLSIPFNQDATYIIFNLNPTGFKEDLFASLARYGLIISYDDRRYSLLFPTFFDPKMLIRKTGLKPETLEGHYKIRIKKNPGINQLAHIFPMVYWPIIVPKRLTPSELVQKVNDDLLVAMLSLFDRYCIKNINEAELALLIYDAVSFWLDILLAKAFTVTLSEIASSNIKANLDPSSNHSYYGPTLGPKLQQLVDEYLSTKRALPIGKSKYPAVTSLSITKVSLSNVLRFKAECLNEYTLQNRDIKLPTFRKRHGLPYHELIKRSSTGNIIASICLDLISDHALTESYNGIESENTDVFKVARFYNATDEGYDDVLKKMVITAERADVKFTDLWVNKIGAVLTHLGLLPDVRFRTLTVQRGKVVRVQPKYYGDPSLFLENYLTHERGLGRYISNDDQGRYRMKPNINHDLRPIPVADSLKVDMALQFLFFELPSKLNRAVEKANQLKKHGNKRTVNQALSSWVELWGRAPEYGIRCVAELLENGLKELSDEKVALARRSFEHASLKCVCHEEFCNSFIELFKELGKDYTNEILSMVWSRMAILPSKSLIRRFSSRLAQHCLDLSYKMTYDEKNIETPRHWNNLILGCVNQHSAECKPLYSGDWWIVRADLRDSSKLENGPKSWRTQKEHIVHLAGSCAGFFQGHLTSAPKGDEVVYGFQEYHSAIMFATFITVFINEIAVALSASSGLALGIGTGLAHGRADWNDQDAYAHGPPIDAASKMNKEDNRIKVLNANVGSYSDVTTFEPAELFEEHFLKLFPKSGSTV